MAFADHFSAVAARYARYRPHYPQALVDALVSRCARHELAWDAGCGNGQLSVELAASFEHVIATDPSRAQLDSAEPHARVEYRCVTAEQSGLPDACADLAVAAQAAHWFDWPRYVVEVGRIARPGALVALVAYNTCTIEGAAGEIVLRYYHDLDAYWPPERRIIESGYRELVWPWPAVDAPALDMIARWTRDELTGYLATWSATQRAVAANGPSRYEAVCAELTREWPDAEQRREIRWPLALQFARR